MSDDKNVLLVKRWMAKEFFRFLRGKEVDHNIEGFLKGPRNASIPIRIDFMLTDDLRRVLEAGETAEFSGIPLPGIDKT